MKDTDIALAGITGFGIIGAAFLLLSHFLNPPYKTPMFCCKEKILAGCKTADKTTQLGEDWEWQLVRSNQSEKAVIMPYQTLEDCQDSIIINAGGWAEKGFFLTCERK